MARRKRKRSKRSRAIPISPLLGVAGALLTPWGAYQDLLEGDFNSYFDKVIAGLTGYSPIVNQDFDFSRLGKGLGLILLGMGVHKVANYIGINRILAKYKLPIRL